MILIFNRHKLFGILYAGWLYKQHACFYSKFWPISWGFWKNFESRVESPIQVFHFWKWEKFRSRQNNNITVNIKNHKLARDTKMIIGRLSLVFRIKTSILTRLSLFRCMRWCFGIRWAQVNSTLSPYLGHSGPKKCFRDFSNMKGSKASSTNTQDQPLKGERWKLEPLNQ